MASTDGNLEKRIKRRIIGRVHAFFVATSPGMEALCLSEIREHLPHLTDARETAGGVMFSGRVHDCYAANLNLRTANRILMRVAMIRATNFKKLAKMLQAVDWELFVPRNSIPLVKVSAARSRIMHTGAVADICRTVIGERIGLPAGGASGEEMSPDIYIRASDDVFTVSIDSSGPLLYKRGLKQHGGRAPLRETLAAAILMMAGYDGREVLLDPMCGSGTFGLEAAMMRRRIPPGLHREFAFEKWPCFRPQRWRYIKKEAGSHVLPPDTAGIFSADQDMNACAALERTIETAGLEKDIQVFCRDFFSLTPHAIASDMGRSVTPGMIVLNPPYGKRIGREAESRDRMAAILQKMFADFAGWRFAVLAPSASLPGALPDHEVRVRPVFHGGLKLRLVTGRIRMTARDKQCSELSEE